MRRRRRRGKNIHGWFALNKPRGITSMQAVEKVRRIFKAAKAGHGGTLDPFCEGLLPIGFGEATKTLSFVLEGDKRYICHLRFGMETDSGDLTGGPVWQSDIYPEIHALKEVIPQFTGEIEQVPPAFSAIHVNGVRAHTLARRGESVTLAPRKICIHKIKLRAYDFHEGLAELEVSCSKGSYMRALARDLGRKLSCGAHLVRLERIKTLGFSKEDMVSLEQLQHASAEGESLQNFLFPIDQVLDDIPVLMLSEEEKLRIRQGQQVLTEAVGVPSGLVRLMTEQRHFFALGRLEDRDSGMLRTCRPKRVFNHLND
ncbi:tRNA pseudouridine(55) synthase TruB [Magnetococcales bacterium HHB-1]